MIVMVVLGCLLDKSEHLRQRQQLLLLQKNSANQSGWVPVLERCIQGLQGHSTHIRNSAQQQHTSEFREFVLRLVTFSVWKPHLSVLQDPDCDVVTVQHQEVALGLSSWKHVNTEQLWITKSSLSAFSIMSRLAIYIGSVSFQK